MEEENKKLRQIIEKTKELSEFRLKKQKLDNWLFTLRRQCNFSFEFDERKKKDGSDVEMEEYIQNIERLKKEIEELEK